MKLKDVLVNTISIVEVESDDEFLYQGYSANAFDELDAEDLDTDVRYIEAIGNNLVIYLQ